VLDLKVYENSAVSANDGSVRVNDCMNLKTGSKILVRNLESEGFLNRVEGA
jgi:hypothetical protein